MLPNTILLCNGEPARMTLPPLQNKASQDRLSDDIQVYLLCRPCSQAESVDTSLVQKRKLCHASIESIQSHHKKIRFLRGI